MPVKTKECMEDWYWICSGHIWKTATGSIVDCRAYQGLVLSLSELLRIRRYWICAGLQSIGRTCTGSRLHVTRRTGTVMDCTVYGEVVLGL